MARLAFYTIEEMIERARADHARWRGHVIQTNILIGGNGNDWMGFIDLPDAVEVTISQMGLQDFYEEGELLLDTYYDISEEVGPFPAFAECPNATAYQICGPTYYADGTVNYPGWWLMAE